MIWALFYLEIYILSSRLVQIKIKTNKIEPDQITQLEQQTDQETRDPLNYKQKMQQSY